jgi:hypothetical protein
MVTECAHLVSAHHETMGDVDIEPLSLLDTLVQLLRSNITINAMLHNTTPSGVLLLLCSKANWRILIHTRWQLGE